MNYKNQKLLMSKTAINISISTRKNVCHDYNFYWYIYKPKLYSEIGSFGTGNFAD